MGIIKDIIARIKVVSAISIGWRQLLQFQVILSKSKLPQQAQIGISRNVSFPCL
jgi:hypothetical protein